MSLISQLSKKGMQVRGGVTALRSFSSVAPCLNESNLSSKKVYVDPTYRPGKSGYAPGFRPPPGSHLTPPPKKDSLTIKDLPKQPLEALHPSDPKKRYKQQLSQLRWQFKKELLTLQEERLIASRAKKERQHQILLQKREERELKRKEYEEARRTQPGDDLAPEALLGEIKPSDPAVDAKKLAKREVRLKHYRAREEKLSEERLKQALKLYYHTADFVTPSNLEDKIKVFMLSPPKKYIRTISDMLADLREMGGVVDQRRAEARLEELQEVLDGTTMKGKLGVEKIQQWKKTENVVSAGIDKHF
ncbi:hypothetical protein K493DRAFT_320275 [Basidiobolus meristosporus CBS 931.73]|uniref:Uncharacterized protein n=1 Tax=Basidiobolus meristosporus CBS 931.73 TaxID=1314790 RepID=A0A1Y1XC44_9FUNG|nr:hypothetical protein K493DRAFT_320275 [Basidiobolus meristosporus CBS 931.73]|eukprot:ORX83308.1 hypothetical protein K493DRAFT_320275 [Basidiobolus meristosporus CBS 931.73]